MRVRGTVEAMDGAMYVVKTRSGDTVKVALTDKPLFVAMAKVSMARHQAGHVRRHDCPAAGRRQSARGSRCTSSPRRCGAPARATARGILNRIPTMTNANVEAAGVGRQRPDADDEVQGRREDRCRHAADRRRDLRARRQGRGQAGDQDPSLSAAEKKPDGTLQDRAHHLRQGTVSRRRCSWPQIKSSSPSKTTGASSG